MLFATEHCAMTALAFRQDAEIRALPKMSNAQLTLRARELEATRFERGDHMPDGTILSADHAVRQADPYDTRDYLMPPQELLKNKVAGKVVGRGTPLTVAVDIGGHCHSVSHPSQPLTNPKTALEWLNAEESRRLLEQDTIRKFQQEYLIQDPRQPGRATAASMFADSMLGNNAGVESSRKATIRAAFEAARLDELHTPRLTSDPTKHLLANPPAASWPTLYEMELQQRPLRMAVERGMIPAGGLKASDLFKAGMV